jgi:two-component system, chemotaxis family, chemotaxis protein CheY
MSSKNHLKSKSVLIVDDDRVIRLILRKHLTKLGMVIVGEAATGLDGAYMYDKYHPDIVLLDVQMPKGNGLTILRLIHEINPKAVVIMLTGDTAEDVIKNAINLGAHDYISKRSEDLPERLAESLMKTMK